MLLGFHIDIEHVGITREDLAKSEVGVFLRAEIIGGEEVRKGCRSQKPHHRNLLVLFPVEKTADSRRHAIQKLLVELRWELGVDETKKGACMSNVATRCVFVKYVRDMMYWRVAARSWKPSRHLNFESHCSCQHCFHRCDQCGCCCRRYRFLNHHVQSQ